MRIAVISDIHGNLTAFEAVLADLRLMSPDLILHGGDLGDTGSRPAEVIDQIRDRGWRGVLGNTDEMLFAPERLTQFAASLPALKPMFDAIEEMAGASRSLLGQDRLDWLRTLPMTLTEGPLGLVHASPASTWRVAAAFEPLRAPIIIHGHTHIPSITNTVMNSGSVGLPYDGDQRASYLLLDDTRPAIRRVEYDVDRELKALRQCGRPHVEWTARMLEAAGPAGL
jgi:putative phosphoesterase